MSQMRSIPVRALGLRRRTSAICSGEEIRHELTKWMITTELQRDRQESQPPARDALQRPRNQLSKWPPYQIITQPTTSKSANSIALT